MMIVAATLAVAVVARVSAPSPTPTDKATAALDSLWSTFWSPAPVSYLLREAPAASRSPGLPGLHVGAAAEGPPLLPFWNYQEAVAAMALGAKLDYARYGPRVQAMVAGQARMGAGRQQGTGTGPGPSGTDGWTREYFDDMNWAVLALLSAHDAAAAAGDTSAAHDYLNGAGNSTARNIFGSMGGRPFPQTVVSAWDARDCGGGVFWDRNRTQKATASVTQCGSGRAAVGRARVGLRTPSPLLALVVGGRPSCARPRAPGMLALPCARPDSCLCFCPALSPSCLPAPARCGNMLMRIHSLRWAWP